MENVWYEIDIKNGMPPADTPVLIAAAYKNPNRKKSLVGVYVDIATRIGDSWHSDSDEYKLMGVQYSQPYAWAEIPHPPRPDLRKVKWKK